MIKLIIEKLKEGTFIYSIKKTIKGKLGSFWKVLKQHDVYYFLDAERVFTKRLIDTFPANNENHIPVGNYYLDKRMPLTENSIVYSIGILNEISFDKAVAEKFDSQIFMYDPTPISIKFMKQYEGHRNFKFFPLGLWIENTVLKFYLPNDASSASMMSENSTSKYFEATCKTLKELMAENGHQEIDVLKMDIEGAALPILEQLLEEGHIFPNQIVVELERPMNNVRQNIDFFYRAIKLCDLFQEEGYEISTLPREASSYYSIELLFVKTATLKTKNSEVK